MVNVRYVYSAPGHIIYASDYICGIYVFTCSIYSSQIMADMYNLEGAYFVSDTYMAVRCKVDVAFNFLCMCTEFHGLCGHAARGHCDLYLRCGRHNVH